MGVKKRFGAVAIAIVLAACSDGEKGESGTVEIPGADAWTPNTFLPSASFKNQCARPRTGTDSNGQPFPDTQGTTLTENNWLRSWTNELYLWYDEVEDHNPAAFASEDYFRLLKTFETTPSDEAKDKFHFTTPTDEWELSSQSGTDLGYGVTFLFINNPRQVIVQLVEPHSPGAGAGLVRGDRVVSVDTIDINSSNTTALTAGLLPGRVSETHTFGIRKADGSTQTLTMTSQLVASTPVHTVSVIQTDSGPVGYMLFNAHIATAEDGLIDAITTLSAANVTDLVLDLRYNSGGYGAIASQAAYMIAGAQTGGQDFARAVWNDKHTTTNPVTGSPLAPMPFIDTTIGLSRPEGTPLPTLNLSSNRVFVITTAETCSASEMIINGLRGVDVEVIQIGNTTCGKPYGFYDFDNCGTTYFSVQFQNLNAKGFGDYTDGFTPADTPDDELGTRIPGCTAVDDPTHALGDPAENMLSVALAYRAGGACPAPESTSLGSSKTSRTAKSIGVIPRPPYRKIQRMRPEDFTR